MKYTFGERQHPLISQHENATATTHPIANPKKDD